MRPFQPRLEIAKDPMDMNQVARVKRHFMPVSCGGQWLVTHEIIRPHNGAYRDIGLHKADKGASGNVGYDAKPQPSNTLFGFPLAMTQYLYGSSDNDLALCASATFAFTRATNIGFVNLHDAMNLVSLRTHHASPKLVEHLEGGFVGRIPACRWNCKADMPGVCVVTRCAPRNHLLRGVRVRCMIVPAVTDA